MKILAFDTATMETTCAVVEDKKVLAASSINSRLSHSETLVSMIEEMLSALALEMKDLDMIAVGVGPEPGRGILQPRREVAAESIHQRVALGAHPSPRLTSGRAPAARPCRSRKGGAMSPPMRDRKEGCECVTPKR